MPMSSNTLGYTTRPEVTTHTYVYIYIIYRRGNGGTGGSVRQESACHYPSRQKHTYWPPFWENRNARAITRSWRVDDNNTASVREKGEWRKYAQPAIDPAAPRITTDQLHAPPPIASRPRLLRVTYMLCTGCSPMEIYTAVPFDSVCNA